jgi:cell division protein FtsZ
MIQFDLPKQKSSIIKVLGVGGGGSNAVNFMFHQDIEGVDFIICNTDSKAIEQSPVPNKIQLGPHLTQGLGAGADPSVGKLATEESLEEIKKILEVNTKMAFITVGMGGGTGTGGAPIIAKICKDLGILTVGIVTTPFSFEGPRRQKQAEDGINQLKPLVDTLLVISNDKLRVQYGNLKMKEAFTKADNVLATAAKCITDVINSRGHIIVDFADVCTVMKNGGVAILGKAEVEGENRAQRAIEEALNSPLLNDNDIKGAKWILLNINSAEGDFECSMDELETISSILRERTGENSDVIMGSGYDDTLGEKIGITLIATGFEGKDPFKKEDVKKETIPTEEKIVMTLASEEKALINDDAANTNEPIAQAFTEELMQSEVVMEAPAQAENHFILDINNESPLTYSFDLNEEMQHNEESAVEEANEIMVAEVFNVEEASEIANVVIEAANVVEEIHLAPTLVEETDYVSSVFVETPTEEEHEEEVIFQLDMDQASETTTYDFTVDTSSFILNKPTNIYVEEENAPAFDEKNEVTAFDERNEVVSFDERNEVNAFDESNEDVALEESVVSAAVEHVQDASPMVEAVAPPENFETSFRVVLEEEPTMQLVVREEAFEATKAQARNTAAQNFEMPLDDSEEQRRKVRERIQKLRNLSFNIGNSNDQSAEFDEVPAYVRRNMDLFGNTLASVENYYSKYTVDQDDKNQTQISTINSFLDGKKPD